MAWGWNGDEEPEQGNISRKARVGRQVRARREVQNLDRGAFAPRKEKKMDVINISEIRKYLGRMQIDLEIVLHAIDTKSLVGEINRPEAPAEKKPRKKRTRKVKVVEPGIVIANILDSSLPDAEKTKRKRRTKKEMELEKGYQEDVPPKGGRD